jgi:hypothetical protein
MAVIGMTVSGRAMPGVIVRVTMCVIMPIAVRMVMGVSVRVNVSHRNLLDSVRERPVP